jgi:hypothetical protein
MSPILRFAGAILAGSAAMAAAASPASITMSLQNSAWAVADHTAGETVFCRSRESYNECPKEFPGPAVLIRQVSRKRCVEGETWGTKRRAIWVEDGCAGIFGQRPEPGSEAEAAADTPGDRTGL